MYADYTVLQGMVSTDQTQYKSVQFSNMLYPYTALYMYTNTTQLLFMVEWTYYTITGEIKICKLHIESDNTNL